MSRRRAFVEIRPPDVAAAGHAERREDERIHHVVQRLAFDLFDGALEIDETFAGVAETLARREMNGEVAAAAPVGKTGAMAEHEARRDFAEPGIVFDVGFGEIA